MIPRKLAISDDLKRQFHVDCQHYVSNGREGGSNKTLSDLVNRSTSASACEARRCRHGETTA